MNKTMALVNLKHKIEYINNCFITVGFLDAPIVKVPTPSTFYNLIFGFFIFIDLILKLNPSLFNKVLSNLQINGRTIFQIVSSLVYKIVDGVENNNIILKVISLGSTGLR